MIFLNVPAAADAVKRTLSILSFALTALLLIINTVSDIRSMQIAVKATRYLTLILLLLRICPVLFTGQIDAAFISSLFLSLLPGILLKAFSLICPEMIGGGDGDIICALGCALTFDDVLFSLLWAFLAAGIYGLILLIRHRSIRSEFPFIPFLSIGTAITGIFHLILRYCP